MYQEEDLTDAVKAGIFSAESVAQFRAWAAQKQQQVSSVDEENFRLVSSFNDIFVSIAILLLLGSLVGLSTVIFDENMGTLMGSIISAAAAWGLTEYFVRKRHMALPAIILLGAFIFSISSFGVSIVKLIMNPINIDDSASYIGIFIAAIVAIATWLHWRRFAVPITVAASIATVVVCVLLPLTVTSQLASNSIASIIPYLWLICGLLTFITALWWDAKDVVRQTRHSDVAFWLHIAAAPMMVHPIFTFIGVFNDQISLFKGALVVGIYLLLGVVSVVIDRRALLVSALGYVLYVLSALFKSFGAAGLPKFAIAGAIMGSMLLLLTVYWHPIRTAILQILPQKLVQKLPSKA